MAATSLKLPDDLKKRLERLAAQAHKTTHAFMVDVLSREAERAELRERFASESAQSEREVLSGGKTFAMDTAFDYLEDRLAGTKSRRPRGRTWRGSK